MEIIRWLDQLDKEISIGINAFHIPSADFLMYWISNKFTWLPLYLILFILIYRKSGKKSLLIIVVTGILITFTDQSATFVKDFFQRLRPCHDTDLNHLIHLVGNCGGKFGFFSGHAANTFAIATFINFIIRDKHPIIGGLLLFWAAIVSYSRIYNGVHYFGDVITAALFGIVIGTVASKLYDYLRVRIYKNH